MTTTTEQDPRTFVPNWRWKCLRCKRSNPSYYRSCGDCNWRPESLVR